MDDYTLSSLTESKNEWCARLVSIFTPAVIQGLKSIFQEAWSLCEENDELDKYLLTFQTFLSRVPKWNAEIIENERKRIVEVSSCGYLEDLISCVHIIQLKALTCIRVGQKQKKIDVDIPSVDNFVHKVYISVARKVYTNVYLFEKEVAPLQIQKHNRELEIIIKECIMESIRDTMPVEDILRSYIGETEEEEVEVKEEIIEKPAPEPSEEEIQAAIQEEVEKAKKDADKKDAGKKDDGKKDESSNSSLASDKSSTISNDSAPSIKVDTAPLSENIKLDVSEAPSNIAFSDIDTAVTVDGSEEKVEAPKTIERLEKIAHDAQEKRKAEEAMWDEEDDDLPLKIGKEVKLELADINDLNRSVKVTDVPQLEIETLV